MSEHTPNRFYDLIMKGGITSGILYPPAICRIAKAGYLHGIGGTSAGAIGACFAAAAEYRRRQHLGDADEAIKGYAQLAELPHKLGEEGRLLSLFEADEPTKSLFDKIKRETGLIETGWLSRSWRWATSIPRYGWYYVRRESMLKPLVNNHMGLCTGMANGVPVSQNNPPLVPWLHRQLNNIAGLDPNGPPLTFGHLWSARVPPMLQAYLGETSPGIDLKLITTCLTFGRPYTLPLADRRFMFDAAELGRYFPEAVNKYLIEKAESYDSEYAKQVDLLPLPVGADMPVILAMRMSLSFPVLFSLVPLWTRSADIDPNTKPKVRAYFLDGGVTSNLPIHFFDSPLPRWPTLAINLQYRREDHRPERHPSSLIRDGLFIPQNNSGGIDPLYFQVDVGDTELSNQLRYNGKRYCDETNKAYRKRLKKHPKRTKERSKAIVRLRGLANAIFRSAQTWNDMSTIVLPGYRQRVAEQWLEPNEGGMNLNMSECVIQQLIAKGEGIGEELVQRFDPQNRSGDPMTWEDHRWVRMRASMAALAKLLHDVRRGFTQQLPPDADFRSLITGNPSNETKPGDKRRSYKMGAQQLNDAATWLDDLKAMADKLEAMAGITTGEDPRTKPFHGGPVPGLEYHLRAAEPYRSASLREAQSNDNDDAAESEG